MEILKVIKGDTPFDEGKIVIAFSLDEFNQINDALIDRIDILNSKIKNNLENGHDEIADLFEALVENLKEMKAKFDEI